MLELWGMRSTPPLPLFPGPLWPGEVTLDKGPIYGLNKTKLVLTIKLCTYAKLKFEMELFLTLKLYLH